MRGEPIPIACTLSAAELGPRLEQWRAVAARSTGRESRSDGVRLAFPRDEALAARIATLAVAETECCAFFRMSVVIEHDAVWLDVRAPVEARALVDELLALS